MRRINRVSKLKDQQQPFVSRDASGANQMSIGLLGLLIVLLLLYGHVSNNVEKYGNSGNLVSRTIILFWGLVFGAGGAFLFLKSVAEPTWAFGSGFIFGPLFAVAACVYLLVGTLCPLEVVRGLLRYSFRHKFGDEFRG